MTTPSPIRQAVCYLLMSSDDRVLAISRLRKDEDGVLLRGENGDPIPDLNDWGLPGGKVDPNESLADAVVREMFEETGIVVASPQPVYTARVPGDTNFMCTTFVGRKVAQTPDAPRSLPYEGNVCWVHPYRLTGGPFGAYNRSLFDHMSIPHSRMSVEWI